MILRSFITLLKKYIDYKKSPLSNQFTKRLEDGNPKMSILVAFEHYNIPFYILKS